MTETKHTPGPWTVDNLEDLPARIRWGTMDICYLSREQPDDEIKANASLISAAPELLEAAEAVPELEETFKIFHPFGDYKPFDKLRKAIAKAKGQA